MSLRCREWKRAGCVDPAEPDLRRQPVPQDAIAGEGGEHCERRGTESAHTLWIAEPGAERPAVPRPLRGKSVQPGRCVPSGDSLAVADGAVHYGVPGSAWTVSGGTQASRRVAGGVSGLD